MERTLEERTEGAWASVHCVCGFDIWRIIEGIEKMEESTLVDEMKKLSDKYVVDLSSSIESPDTPEMEKEQLENFFIGFYNDEELYRQAIYEEFKHNYDKKYVGRMVYSDYIIYGHKKIEWKPKFVWDKNLPMFVYCEDGSLFETTQDNIYSSKDFPKDVPPKKFPTLDDANAERKKIKKEFPELDWDSVSTKEEFQKYV